MMKQILDFLAENPTFYYATADGNKPRVRPFGFYMEFEGKLYIGMGKHKASYRQTVANPNVELCTANPAGRWLRIRGAAAADDRKEALEKAFEVMPRLKQIYNEQTGFQLGLFCIRDGVAEFADLQGNFESFSF